MASISNLAVVISGQTDPLAKSLKKAEKDINNFKQGSSFMGGVGHGVGFGMGFLGLDHVGKSIKKAAKEMPALEGVFDKLETAAGRFIINLTKMDQWLPSVGKAIDELVSKDNIGQAWQEWAEQVESVRMKYDEFESDENIRKRVDAMREEYNLQVMASNFQAKMLSMEESRKKLAEDRAKQFQTETDAYISKLKSERDALDPNRDEKEAEKFKSTGDVFKDAEIALIKMQTEELKEKKWIEEETQKLLEDEQKKREQINSMMDSAEEKLLEQQYNEIDLLMQKMELLGATNVEMERYRDLLEEAAYLKQEDAFNKAVEEMESEGYEETKKQRGTGESAFAGAAEAGSQAAYSAIVNGASAADMSNSMKQQVVATKENVKGTKAVELAVNEAKKAFEQSKVTIKVLTLGGAM